MSNRKASSYLLILLLLVEVWAKKDKEIEAEVDEKKARRDFEKAILKRARNGDPEEADIEDRYRIFKDNKKKHDKFIKKYKYDPVAVFKVDEESVFWLKTDAELQLMLGLANLTQIQIDEPKVRPGKVPPGKEKSKKKKKKKDEKKARAKKLKDKGTKPKQMGLNKDKSKVKGPKKGDKKKEKEKEKKVKPKKKKGNNLRTFGFDAAPFIAEENKNKAEKKEAREKNKKNKAEKKETREKNKEEKMEARKRKKKIKADKIEARKIKKKKREEARARREENKNIKNKKDETKITEEAEEQLVKRQTSAIPDKMDLRNLGYVGKMKNQKSCGSCWAFGAVCVIEGALSMITGRSPVPLSEQQIIHCNKAGYGCDGGFWTKAWKEIRDHNYIALQRGQRYMSKRDESLCKRTTKNGLGNQLTVGTWSILKEEDDEEAMLGMMVDFGPIAVSIHASEEVFYYESGYIDMCLGGKTNLNHLVTMVGYDAGTLILKNSWGKWWGQGGYFKVRRDCGLHGFSYWASFATVVPRTASGWVKEDEEEEVVVVAGSAFTSFITLEEQAMVAELSAIGGLREDSLLVIQFNELDSISNFTISLHDRNSTSSSHIDPLTNLPAFLSREVRLLTYNTDPITLEWSSDTQKCRLLTAMMEPPLEVVLHAEEHACPLTPGSNFTVEIDVTGSGYTFTVGDTELEHYPHRLDLETVTDFRMVYQEGPKVVTTDGVATEGIAIERVVIIRTLEEILNPTNDELVVCFDKDIYCADRHEAYSGSCEFDPWMIENCIRTCGKCQT